MKSFVSAALAALMLCAILGGCGTSASGAAISGEVTVVFVPKLTGNAFFEAANAGAQAYAEAHG